MAQCRDFFGNLVAGQLTTLTRLSPLGHLYLEHPGVGKILYRHAESTAGDLLYPAVG